MKISTSLLLALAAGSAITGVASAQKSTSPKTTDRPVVDTVIPNDRAIEMTPPSSFGDRGTTTVYSVGVPSETGGTWNNPGNNIYGMADDISFVPGPGSAGGFTVNGIAFGWVVQPTIVAPNNNVQVRIRFHDTYQGPTTPPYAGAVVGQMTNFNVATVTGITGAIIQYYPAAANFGWAVPFVQAAADTTCTAFSEIYKQADGLPSNDVAPAYRGTVPANEAGSSPVETLHTLNATTSAWGTFGAAGNNRKLYLKLTAAISIPAPTCDGNVGTIPDAGASTGVAAGNNVAWYCFSIATDAFDDAGGTADGQFLDIDTEGSAQDLSLAIYDGAGARMAFDADSGSGGSAMISLGMGRRAAVGDGDQYAGQHGELAAGAYYLAVAPAGATFATNGYGVTSGTALTAGNTVRFATNTNGTPLAPSVAPIATDLGLIDGIAGIVSTPADAPAPFRVLWYRFETCETAANDPTWLDISMDGSSGITDSELFIFDNNGNLVATDDDSGAALTSQLSFGDTNSANHNAFVPQGDAVPYAGQNGTLPAGVYYMGVGLFDTVEKPLNPDTNGRWHLRNTSGSSLVCQEHIGVSWLGCGASCTDSSGTIDFSGCPWGTTNNQPAPCCPYDFNGSGGAPDDADVSAFFAAWNAGDLCGDVNKSGGAPDDADVSNFFAGWNAGGC